MHEERERSEHYHLHGRIYASITFASLQKYLKGVTKCLYVRGQCINKLYNYLQYIYIYIHTYIQKSQSLETVVPLFFEGRIKNKKLGIKINKNRKRLQKPATNVTGTFTMKTGALDVPRQRQKNKQCYSWLLCLMFWRQRVCFI